MRNLRKIIFNAVSLTVGLILKEKALLLNPVPPLKFSIRSDGLRGLNEDFSYFGNNNNDIFQGTVKKQNNGILDF
ncbi:hypothetical protein DENIS_2716 [Desulfonema ishimotonii]|uniref:Uncharacterized protein n=1 Tax=Desulfonema ishimotonii TaxID=45657 RepID=A0A401FXU5_9BACT|nr:hypothetical protein DENIS_2716 [Desulfonema ishimotonii]